MKSLAVVIFFFSLTLSPNYALIQAMSSGRLAEEKSSKIYVKIDNPRYIIIGPYFGCYFESEDTGKSFRVVKEKPSKEKFLNSEQEGKILYKLTEKDSQVDLYVSEDAGKNWDLTSLGELFELIDEECRRGSLVLVREDNLTYILSIVFSLVIVFSFAFLLRGVLKTKITFNMILGTTIFYGIVLWMPVSIIPQFAKVFQEMKIPLPVTTQFYCIISVSSVGILIYILAFTIFSPLVLEQISQLVEEEAMAGVLGMLYFFSIGGFFATSVIALFLPLIL